MANSRFHVENVSKCMPRACHISKVSREGTGQESHALNKPHGKKGGEELSNNKDSKCNELKHITYV